MTAVVRRALSAVLPSSIDLGARSDPTAAVWGSGVEKREMVRELNETRAQLRQAREELQRAYARERQASQRALHDSLTSLPNRELFRARLEQALQDDVTKDAVAVLYIDLDGFKDINDTHGHAVGDELLQIIGTRLSRAVRASDTVARLGGDEFACLLVGVTDPHQVAERARLLVKAVSARMRVADCLIQGRASIGVAMSRSDGKNSDGLLNHADAAMYRAKRSGSGIEFYSPLDLVGSPARSGRGVAAGSIAEYHARAERSPRATVSHAHR